VEVAKAHKAKTAKKWTEQVWIVKHRYT
jgi:hypothetical protein